MFDTASTASSAARVESKAPTMAPGCLFGATASKKRNAAAAIAGGTCKPAFSFSTVTSTSAQLAKSTDSTPSALADTTPLPFFGGAGVTFGVATSGGMTTTATKSSAARAPPSGLFGLSQPVMPSAAAQTSNLASSSSGAGFLFGVAPVGGTMTVAAVTPASAISAFGFTSTPAPTTAAQTNVPASLSYGAGFSFGATPAGGTATPATKLQWRPLLHRFCSDLRLSLFLLLLHRQTYPHLGPVSHLGQHQREGRRLPRQRL